MGEIVGAAIVSHVPPIVMPEAVRRELNGGEDFTLVDGLHRLRRERLDRLAPDTVVVLDTHWFTTFEHVISAHERRHGRFTSSELPRGMAGMPYDYRGDPELAHAVAKVAADRDDTWVHATDDPHIEVFYPTVNLLPFLQRDERWVSAGICQTAEPADFLLFGEVLAAAIAQLDRRVVVLGSGGLSHRFWPLRELRAHESASLDNIVSAEARAADEELLARLQHGDHAAVIDGMPQFAKHAPEGYFGHYLVMAGAIGGRACRARGEMYSQYESAAGTGQAHVWFERPAGGWTS
jgi:3,4-dihydroxyphenylacetate 2,3-dioxygenase